MPKDVTQYAAKPPTDFHKWFAGWIVREVGYRPSEAESLKEAFLMGVSIACTARTAFQESEFLEEMRAKHGVNKRGPKPAVEEEEKPAARRPVKKAAPRKRAPEPVEEDWESDEAEADDDFEDDTEDAEDDFEDGSEDDTEDADDDFDDDDFEEAPPTPKRGRPAAKKVSAPAKRTAAPARKAAPAKKAAPTKAAARQRGAKVADDFMF